MQITRFSEAKSYTAPLHSNMLGLRLQGAEATQTSNFWVGYSQFLPGGGAGNSCTPMEKVYVVLNGEITIRQGKKDTILAAKDSCVIPAGEMRELINHTNDTVSMMVIMPYEGESK